jgi:hypothetical protein
MVKVQIPERDARYACFHVLGTYHGILIGATCLLVYVVSPWTQHKLSYIYILTSHNDLHVDNLLLLYNGRKKVPFSPRRP